jgi:hypothetical protein
VSDDFEVIGEITDSEKIRFAICINDGGYPESLEVLKIYQVVPDPDAAKHRQLRVIDESGEDYLYFEELFIQVDFPASVEMVLSQAATHQH